MQECFPSQFVVVIGVLFVFSVLCLAAFGHMVFKLAEECTELLYVLAE